MGPLAGPVVAAAVVFDAGAAVDGLADSKALTRKQRERLAETILLRARAVGVGVVDPPEVDRLNVYRAGQEAMRRALAALAPLVPDYLLVDGREVPRLGIPQSAYPKGDAFVASIAAASIVAKVRRDAIMRALGEAYPAYGFERHMGYGTAAHLAARLHRSTRWHRASSASAASSTDGRALRGRAWVSPSAVSACSTTPRPRPCRRTWWPAAAPATTTCCSCSSIRRSTRSAAEPTRRFSPRPPGGTSR
jgi:ribonuclease HII